MLTFLSGAMWILFSILLDIFLVLDKLYPPNAKQIDVVPQNTIETKEETFLCQQIKKRERYRWFYVEYFQKAFLRRITVSLQYHNASFFSKALYERYPNDLPLFCDHLRIELVHI